MRHPCSLHGIFEIRYKPTLFSYTLCCLPKENQKPHFLNSIHCNAVERFHLVQRTANTSVKRYTTGGNSPFRYDDRTWTHWYLVPYIETNAYFAEKVEFSIVLYISSITRLIYSDKYYNMKSHDKHPFQFLLPKKFEATPLGFRMTSLSFYLSVTELSALNLSNHYLFANHKTHSYRDPHRSPFLSFLLP